MYSVTFRLFAISDDITYVSHRNKHPIPPLKTLTEKGNKDETKH
jgi:hypothetical protein